MGNATWLCFDCRQAVRRPVLYKKCVPCSSCGKPCRCIGTKIPVPPKQDEHAWQVLRESLRQARTDAQQRQYITRIRRRHGLEKRIGELQRRPLNDGRERLLRILRRQLEET